MAWWTKVGEKHDGSRPKLGAMIRLTFAKANGMPMENLGLYGKDPAKHPDTPNLLPEMLEKERQKKLARDIRSLMKKSRRPA